MHNCGYRTYSVYPWLGAFLSARGFQKTLGIDHFYDAKDLKTHDVEPDEFYYAFTADLLGGYGEVVELRSPFPWTMALVRVGS